MTSQLGQRSPCSGCVGGPVNAHTFLSVGGSVNAHMLLSVGYVGGSINAHVVWSGGVVLVGQSMLTYYCLLVMLVGQSVLTRCCLLVMLVGQSMLTRCLVWWSCVGRPVNAHTFLSAGYVGAHTKLQALVYDIFPLTTTIVDYAIGLVKLSANEQLLGLVELCIAVLYVTCIIYHY